MSAKLTLFGKQLRHVLQQLPVKRVRLDRRRDFQLHNGLPVDALEPGVVLQRSDVLGTDALGGVFLKALLSSPGL